MFKIALSKIRPFTLFSLVTFLEATLVPLKKLFWWGWGLFCNGWSNKCRVTCIQGHMPCNCSTIFIAQAEDPGCQHWHIHIILLYYYNFGIPLLCSLVVFSWHSHFTSLCGGRLQFQMKIPFYGCQLFPSFVCPITKNRKVAVNVRNLVLPNSSYSFQEPSL